jgi:hypothetical protein
MSKIEDRLWADLGREPGAELTLAVRQPPSDRRRSSRTSLAAGGALALIGAILAALFVTAGTRNTPAYAVTMNGDGSVTLTLNEVLGVSGANEQLARLGVRAVVAKMEPGCTATGEVVESASSQQHIVEPEKQGEGVGGLRVVIHPNAIPSGDTVQISVQYANDGKPVATIGGQAVYGFAGSWGIYRGRAPMCRPPESSLP